MSVLLIRIDDRLVHGQIVKGWVKYLNATLVTVVSDLLVDNWARRTVMELALPDGVNLQLVSTAQIAQRHDLSANHDTEREIVLFASAADVILAINNGLKINKLNLGGQHHFNGDKKLTTNISLNQQDVSELRQLLDLGVNIQVYALPQEKETDLRDLL